MRKNLNINKTVGAILLFNIIHLVVVIGLLLYGAYIYNFNKLSKNINGIFFLFYALIFVTLFINSFIAVRNALVLSYTDEQYEMLKKTLEHVENLNNTLRGQRHDFMNHLQVVHGLMEMEEYEDAMHYIEQVYSDIQKINRVMKTSIPAINALLQAKLLDCEKRGIKTILAVTSRIEDLKVPSWEMCRVLGNIIDNAIFALEDTRDLSKYLEIEILEDLKSFWFIIKNTGTQIPKDSISKMFEPGFTTKDDKGEGMGLFISKSIVEEYGGKININSDNMCTIFEISIPK